VLGVDECILDRRHTLHSVRQCVADRSHGELHAIEPERAKPLLRDGGPLG
jgi:hypothetical protein